MGETIDFEARKEARIRALIPDAADLDEMNCRTLSETRKPGVPITIDDGATRIADAVLQFVTDIRAEQGEEPSRADIERACRFYGLAQSALEEVRDDMWEVVKDRWALTD